MGVLNPQFAMPSFTNPNAYFSSTQIFPFPPGHAHNLSCSSLNPMFVHNAVNSLQILPNGQLNVPNLVQNVNQLLQMQIASCRPQTFTSVPPNMMNGNGNVQQLMNGNASKQMHGNVNAAKDFGTPQHQQNLHINSPRAAKLQVPSWGCVLVVLACQVGTVRLLSRNMSCVIVKIENHILSSHTFSSSLAWKLDIVSWKMYVWISNEACEKKLYWISILLDTRVAVRTTFHWVCYEKLGLET